MKGVQIKESTELQLYLYFVVMLYLKTKFVFKY